MTTAPPRIDRWFSAWPDLIAFASLLGIAWWTRASTTDLVWSLWLSSLVVGYALILWGIFRLPVQFVAQVAAEPRSLLDGLRNSGLKATLIIAAAGLVMMAFTLAFFTVHFGGFHFVHAGFLQLYFPIVGNWDGSVSLRSHDLAMYREVLRRYWIYLPWAFLAERTAFMHPSKGSLMGLPYRKVMRMHGLIFFFGLAHYLRLDNFAVYAVVYAVYFFPWRLMNRSAAVTEQPAAERIAA